MNEGIKLLMQRMDSHPEEFANRFDPYRDHEPYKWTYIVNEIFHRIEVMDRDAGLENDPSGSRPHRFGKPLPYLSDEEVRMVFDKLMQVQRDQFAHRVMATLLNDQSEDTYASTARMVKITPDGGPIPVANGGTGVTALGVTAMGDL